MDLLKFLILTILLLFPFGELFRISFGGNIVLHVLDIAVVLAALVWCWRGKFINNQLSQAIGLFLLFCIVSLLVNLNWLNFDQFFASALYLLRWISYLIIYFVIKSCDQKFKQFILRGLTIGGGVILVLGYIQFIFFQDLKPLYQFGWDDHMYRMVSTFLDPNFAGAFFVLYLLLIAGQIKSSKKQEKLIYISLLVLTLIAIFLTNSRSSLLMLLTSSIVYLFLIKKKWLIFVILLILVAALLTLRPFSNIENLNLFRTHSIKARLQSWQTAIEIFRKNPILGVGFNTYRYAQIKYGFRSNQTKNSSHADAGTDNSFLFILATTGIMGLISYLLFWGIFLKLQHRKESLAGVFFASIIGLFIHSLFLNSLFYPPIMLWIWILAGLTLSD